MRERVEIPTERYLELLEREAEMDAVEDYLSITDMLFASKKFSFNREEEIAILEKCDYKVVE